MPKVIVRKCPKTGKLFEDPVKYLAHLKKIRKKAAALREHERFRKEKQAFFKAMRDQVRTFDELECFILENQKQFIMHAQSIHRFGTGRKKFRMLKRVKFDIMRYGPAMSNSHSCPKNGVTNWGRNDKFADGTPKPVGYPGWTGTIFFTFESESDGMSLGSDLFNGETCICTGSGGSGDGVNYGYSVTLWADDWPAMRDAHNKWVMANTLSEDKFTLEDVI